PACSLAPVRLCCSHHPIERFRYLHGRCHARLLKWASVEPSNGLARSIQRLDRGLASCRRARRIGFPRRRRYCTGIRTHTRGHPYFGIQELTMPRTGTGSPHSSDERAVAANVNVAASPVLELEIELD